MKSILSQLNQIVGTYVGEGINHEGQTFTGRLQIQPLLKGRGFLLQFSALGKDGVSYHEEQSMIAPSIQQKMILWNFNTNSPGLIPHELRATESNQNKLTSFIFEYNKPDDTNTFREEIALHIWDHKNISYIYSWGLPGGEFKERSGVKMTKIIEPTTSNKAE